MRNPGSRVRAVSLSYHSSHSHLECFLLAISNFNSQDVAFIQVPELTLRLQKAFYLLMTIFIALPILRIRELLAGDEFVS